MRTLILSAFLVGAVGAPSVSGSAPPKAPIQKPVDRATKGCKSVSDCSCPDGYGKSCLNGQCNCHEPVVIEGEKVAPSR